MGVFEENLKALAEIEPELARRAADFQGSERFQAREDGGLSVDAGNGKRVLFPAFQSGSSIPKLSGLGHLKDSDVVLVYGFGLGCHVQELIQATSPKTFILVIDPSLDIFCQALALNDLRQIFTSGRLSLAIEEEPYHATRVRLESYFGVFTLKNIKIFHCLPSLQLSADYFSRVDACVREITQVAERNRATLARFSGVWHQHILENLPEILRSPGITKLFGKFTGRPAIIIAAGPSLDKNVKWLATAKGRALLICVDTALKTLLKNGITPDFLVCLDAVEINYRHVADEATENICLVANPVTFPQILKKHRGRIVMMTFNDPLMVWLEKSIGEKGNTVTGGSVATAAFDFAGKMGASPIFLVGQDLAFTHGEAYTSDSYYCESWRDAYNGQSTFEDFQKARITREEVLSDKDCQGREILTNAGMLSWKRWFEAMIAQGKVHCIHATEGGMNIAGTDVRQLREAIHEYCGEEFHVGRVLDEMDYRLDEGALRDLSQRMKGLEKKLENICRVCKEGVSLSATLLIQTRRKGPDRQRLQSGMARLGKIASDILSEEDFLDLNRWSIDTLIERMQDYKSKSKESPIQASLISYQILLGGIEHLCKTFGRKLDHSLATLKDGTSSSY